MYKPENSKLRVSLLTAGRDKHYSLGLALALASSGVDVDLIASDEFESPELRGSPINFFNLRGDQSVNASLPKKSVRVLAYYVRLFIYAAKSRAKIFHILWNNKFEWFDRTFLMIFYKLLGKQIVLTAHNVNAGKRDGYDSFFNRASLRFQYRLCDRIFVHTNKMKDELVSDFNVRGHKVVLIPYGWNNAIPNTRLTGMEARRRLGLSDQNKIILFFGNIAPYKGLEFLVEAFESIAKNDPLVRLVIAGRPRGPKDYWKQIEKTIAASRHSDRIFQKIEYISDENTEIYFKAADVLVLPYVYIFQSGILFLAYSFGLPVIATNVGSLKEEILENKTGAVCEPNNSEALAHSICKYFQSDLYRELESRRTEIQNFAKEKHSWNIVGDITAATYSDVLNPRKTPNPILKTEKKDETFSLNSDSSLQR